MELEREREIKQPRALSTELIKFILKAMGNPGRTVNRGVLWSGLPFRKTSLPVVHGMN